MTTPTRTRSTSRFGVAESLEGLPSYTQPSRQAPQFYMPQANINQNKEKQRQ